MRPMFWAFMLLISMVANAQTYRADTIYMNDGNIIACRIDHVNDTISRISFNTSPSQNKAIAKDAVRAFKWNGKMYPGSIDWKSIRCEDWPHIQTIIPHKYEKVVTVDGMTAPELFSAFNLWIAEHFKDSEAVTNLSDRTSNIIIINGRYPVCVKGLLLENCNYAISFSLEVRCKDDRFKLEVTNGSFKTGAFDRYSTDFDFAYMVGQSYFRRNRKNEADPVAYSLCDALNDFHEFIERSLTHAATSYKRKDDW